MSKKNRTINHLVDNLDNELAWRIKELNIIKSRIPKSNEKMSSDPIQNAMIRSGVTMLYAHWEGFVKSAATHYLNFVSLRRLKHKELNSCFIALCLKSEISKLDSKKSELHAKTIDFLLNDLNKRAYVPYKRIIDTKSNLKSSVFRDICHILGLNYSNYQLKEKLIDRQLVKYRNKIAHGHWLEIDYEGYMSLFNEILILIRNLKDEIINSAIIESYKRR